MYIKYKLTIDISVGLAGVQPKSVQLYNLYNLIQNKIDNATVI